MNTNKNLPDENFTPASCQTRVIGRCGLLRTDFKQLNKQRMKRELETKFYEFNQNNSGGSFDVDENVCHRVIIEAIDAKHAQSIFEPMIENQSGSCPCCGDRWSSYDPDEIELSKWKESSIVNLWQTLMVGLFLMFAFIFWMVLKRKYSKWKRSANTC